jgi:hypothetical protein
MSNRVRTISIGLLLGALLLSGLAGLSAQAQQQQNPQQNAGAPGARQAIESFFRALSAGDLVLLKDGGALSGTVQGDQFVVNLSSGQSQTLKYSDIALMSFGDKTDQVVLMDGSQVSGSVQIDKLSTQLPTGAQMTVAKSNIAMMIFKLPLPTEGQQGQQGSSTTPQQRQNLFKLFRGLQAQGIFGLFAKSLTSFDLAVFPNQELVSGAIVNQQFVFNSALFGKLTFKASDVAEIDLAASGSSNPDFITLKTGDKLSGTLDAQSAIQFQPVGLTDNQGQPVTLTFNRGDVARVVTRLPASAFGGGKGPGFQGGPGH